MLNHAFKTGLSFGLTSGVITTLGLMIGLNAGTHSKAVVLAGILTIALADAFSDALGVHASEESEALHTSKEIWQSTIFTFLFKFLFALTFALPVILFSLNIAVIINFCWGFFLLTILGYFLAKNERMNPFFVIFEHLFVAFIVVILTHFIGEGINRLFHLG